MAEKAVFAVGGRYTIEHEVGQGGMATVYAAIELSTGKRVALKQLVARDGEGSDERAREYFEREYHTLAQLAHPRIVTVFEYGLDSETPYYTMELLDGGDLLERSPLPWKEACAIALDVCSALSLVHSRRMVYRDLSPRNVRCTSSGRAKLIDFGAMAPMGPAPLAVCTPAVASPEVVYRLPLDGRSDLYALGAMLYFTLTGRNAFPARTFNQLLTLWQQPPRPPSELEPSIPPAVDALVMDLLQLEPQLRPASAAEVSERLCAIAGLDVDEHLMVAQAYLTTPTLVGRERELRKVSSSIERIKTRARGNALLVRGAAGLGRSRFLEACGLAGKLAGLTVVRAAVSAGTEGPDALARAFLSQLLDTVPEEVLGEAFRQTAACEQSVDALREALGSAQANELPLLRDVTLLRALALAVADRVPLLVAVDDFERLDTAGRSLVSLLAHEASSHPLLVVATTHLDRSSDIDPTRLVSGAWTEITLRPLDLAQTHALLASMFGDVPHLVVLVQRLHAVSAGNPQALMLLAQHLLDRGVVRYVAGSWVLPDRLDASDLPESLAQAFRAAASVLAEDARKLGQAIARRPDERFSAEECVALSAHGDWPRTFKALDQLLSASVLTMAGSSYALSSRAWVEPLTGELDAELELRLARVFEARGDGMRAASHLFEIGRNTEGTDVLIAFAKRSYAQTSVSSEAYVQLLSMLPRDWRAIFDKGSALCKAQNRPTSDWLALQQRCSSLTSQNDVCSDGMLSELANGFARDIGLDVYAQLDPTLPSGERLQQALGAAAKRHAETPEHERGLDPKTAIGALARGLVTYIGNFSRSLDVQEWRQIPSLSPLVPLSPSVATVDLLARGFDARVSGRFEQACAIYRETLDFIDQSHGGGLDPTFIESIRAALPSIVGMMEAGLGLASSEEHADQVAEFPLYQGSALGIRMTHRLWLGDIAGALELSRKAEVARLERSHVQTGDALTTLWMLKAHAASDDLTHTRQSLEALERLATKMRTWKPVAAWARSEYERIRGDFGAALAAVEETLAGLPEAEHQVWPFAAAGHVRILCEQGRFAEAKAIGERYLAVAEQRQLGYVTGYIRMPLAVALARLGEGEQAWALVRTVLRTFEQLGVRGINLGLVHETAARVAACLRDEAALEEHLLHCKEAFLTFSNPALAAKYQRLRRALKPRHAGTEDTPAIGDAVSAMARSQMESLLQTCSNSEERLQCALQLLVNSTGAEGGALYGLTDGMLTLRAKSDERGLPPEVEAEAQRFALCELGSGDETASDSGDSASSTGQGGVWTSLEGRCYRPVLLHHTGPDGLIASGLVVLAFDRVRTVRVTGEATSLLSRTMVQAGDLQPVLIAS